MTSTATAALVQALDIPVATGENLYTRADFARFLRRDAVDIIHPTCVAPVDRLQCCRLGRRRPPGALTPHTVVALSSSTSWPSLPNAIYLETGLIGKDSPFALTDGCAPIPQGPGFSWAS